MADTQLDYFKDVDVVLDYADQNISQKIFAAEGDIQGRTLTVQVTNKGRVSEIIGAVLRAVWKNEATGISDITAFDEIDSSNGLFELTYPTHMMTKGNVKMQIQIVYRGATTMSRPFDITVTGINGNFKTIIESQQFSALVQALNQAKKAGPVDSVDSYSDLLSKYPNGADGTVLVLDADGSYHSWLYTDRAWADLGTYQEKGIAKSSIDYTKMNEDISMINYPFSTNSKFDSLLNKRIFKDIKIYDADITKKYCVAGVFRNNNNVWRIMVSILKDDNTVGDLIASWEVTGYTEPSVPVWISLNPQGNSVGKAVDILVDWKQLNGYDSNSFGTGARSALFQIDYSCYTKSKYLANYPFDQIESKIADNSLNKAFLNLEVVNGNLNEQYCIAQLRKNDSGNYRFIISKFSNGVIGDQIASWNRNNYVPNSNIETIKVEKSTNGYDVLVTIDWNQLQNGIYGTNYKNNVLVIDKKTYTTLNSAIEIPVLGMYAVNPQFEFPDYAFFTGNWQKRTLNNTEVMTSTIPTSGLHLGFRGTELVGKFVKDRAGIQLVVQIDDQEPFYKWIDDSNNDTVIATGLADTEHVVKIFADPWFGTSMDDKHSFFTFKGALNVARFKTATYPIFTNGKTLFAYGDSFTAGGGGTLANSYATYTARLLGLGCHRIAQGGAGLVERSDRLFIPNLQQIAFQASNGVYTKPQQADIVTINIGTNDTKTVVTDAVYESNMRDFISKLKIRHYGAPIVLMGDWVNKYTVVCQKIGNDTDNVYFVDVSSWSYPRQDDLHPTDEGHKMIAEKLAEAIRKLNFDV